MVVIGTSATVQPAASLPVIALRAGASVVEINCEPTPLSAVVDISLRGAAGDLLPALAEATGGAVGES
jgi:NAD-dependent deacetylase